METGNKSKHRRVISISVPRCTQYLKTLSVLSTSPLAFPPRQQLSDFAYPHAGLSASRIQSRQFSKRPMIYLYEHRSNNITFADASPSPPKSDFYLQRFTLSASMPIYPYPSTSYQLPRPNLPNNIRIYISPTPLHTTNTSTSTLASPPTSHEPPLSVYDLAQAHHSHPTNFPIFHHPTPYSSLFPPYPHPLRIRIPPSLTTCERKSENKNGNR